MRPAYEDWSLDDCRKLLAFKIFENGAFLTQESTESTLLIRRDEETGFKLVIHEQKPEAPLSPVYLNLRTKSNPKGGPLSEETVRLAGHCMFLLAKSKKCAFEHVVGIPNGGRPFAEIVSQKVNKYTLYLKKEMIDNRRVIHKKLQGYDGVKPKTPVAVVEDLVTSGHSVLMGINVLRESYDLMVTDVLAIVDREQGGCQTLKDHGVNLRALFKISELLQIYRDADKITAATHETIRRYLQK